MPKPILSFSSPWNGPKHLLQGSDVQMPFSLQLSDRYGAWLLAFGVHTSKVARVTQHCLPLAPSLESGCELLFLPRKTENRQAAAHNVFWISSESRLGLSWYLQVLFPTGAGSGFLCHILSIKFETTESKRCAQSLGIMHPAKRNPLLSLTQLNNYGCRNPKICVCMSTDLAM